MKRLLVLLISVLTSFSLWAGSRVVTDFNANWKFSLVDNSKAAASSFNDKAWRTLNLPHDWAIEGENLQEEPSGGQNGYFPSGIAWYRKTFDMPSYAKGKSYSIEFDGVMSCSDVYLNGKHLGFWPYGYSSFSYDLTPYLKAKGNVLSVRVDNSKQPSTRWYAGAGIYRNVRVVETPSTVRIKKWGVFEYTESIQNGNAKLRLETEIENDVALKFDSVAIRQVLIDAEGKSVATVQTPFTQGEAASSMSACIMNVPNPILWNLEQPYLYKLMTYLIADGKEIDCEQTKVGIRTIEYPINGGFLLNGKQVKMKGVNIHHDAGAVGTAVPRRVWERRIEILQSGGCNAIRTAHNHPDPVLLDICDELGMLVMDEAFDCWAEGKNAWDYHVYFQDWYERDLEALVLRDRNHPSVVMWSVGNEVPDQSSNEGPLIARRLINICHKYDPTRLVTQGNDRIIDPSRRATEEYLAEFANDIIGYNYPDRFRDRRETVYTEDKIKHPDRRVVATESGGLSGTRAYGTTSSWGRGFRGMTQNNAEPSLEQQMSGRLPSSSGFIDTEQRWKYTIINDFVIGDFMWTGIDYYGETRWPSRGASSGYLDNCCFKKDGYYFFKSIWSDEPVLHLANGWNYSQVQIGKIMQVSVFTNCDYVELFVNGKSYGVKSKEFPRRGQTTAWNVGPKDKVRTSTADMHLSWDVEYQPGELKLVATKKGQRVEQTFHTPGAPAALRLSLDRTTIKASPDDVAHLEVDVVDKDGNIVTDDDGALQINFASEGAELIGVESGNMSDLTSTKVSYRKAYGGKVLAIYRAPKVGTYKITVSAEGLPDSSVSFRAE